MPIPRIYIRRYRTNIFSHSRFASDELGLCDASSSRLKITLKNPFASTMHYRKLNISIAAYRQYLIKAFSIHSAGAPFECSTRTINIADPKRMIYFRLCARHTRLLYRDKLRDKLRRYCRMRGRVRESMTRAPALILLIQRPLLIFESRRRKPDYK